MDEAQDRMRALSPEDREADVQRARSRLESLVSELDRRRRDLTDVRLQLRKHVWVVAAVGFTLLAGLGTTIFFKVRSRRERRTLRGRVGRLREAVGRMMDAPDRVAKSEPNLLKKIAAAAASTAASNVTKNVSERAVQALTARARG